VSKEEGFLNSFLNMLDKMAPKIAQEELSNDEETDKM
jgi:hypothetical protein